ncbi:hypothetical protein ACJRO7_013294 [Eucalyptus globulus]|uniref:Uncharacterized protein n=1 Tax=Eucalyptus globulus TaxID=34317 RepID=A0ABD3KX71_EUCGL
MVTVEVAGRVHWAVVDPRRRHEILLCGTKVANQRGVIIGVYFVVIAPVVAAFVHLSLSSSCGELDGNSYRTFSASILDKRYGFLPDDEGGEEEGEVEEVDVPFFLLHRVGFWDSASPLLLLTLPQFMEDLGGAEQGPEMKSVSH